MHAGGRAKCRELPLPTLGTVTKAQLLGPCIITEMNRDELTRLPGVSHRLSRVVPTQKPQPPREPWPITDIYCPVN